MSKKLELNIDNSQAKLLDSIDIVNDGKKETLGKLKEDKPTEYIPVKKDFVKVDRNIIDVVIPFLNQHASVGASVLYMDLYRMTYGYGKNATALTDEMIAERMAIPKRTIMEYRKMLVKYDLLVHKKGTRKKRGQFIIKRPEQSAYFTDYLQKTATLVTKSVSNTDENNTIYNIDKFIDSDKLVWGFYETAGWKQTQISRDILDKGVKVINSLYQLGYDKTFIKGLCDWSVKFCLDNKKPIYGIGFITHLLPQYEEDIEKKKKSAAEMKKRKQEMDKLNEEIQQQDFLLQKYNQLPKHLRSGVMTEAKDMLEADANTTNMKLTDVLEKYILDANIIQIMERDYSESL
tara:strand:+ start:1903 stop:2943 length:1041 start_codon:yes stop_codon:yes gene_type:complete